MIVAARNPFVCLRIGLFWYFRDKGRCPPSRTQTGVLTFGTTVPFAAPTSCREKWSFRIISCSKLYHPDVTLLWFRYLPFWNPNDMWFWHDFFWTLKPVLWTSLGVWRLLSWFKLDVTIEKMPSSRGPLVYQSNRNHYTLTNSWILAYVFMCVANFHVVMTGSCKVARLGEQGAPTPCEGISYFLCRIISLEI